MRKITFCSLLLAQVLFSQTTLTPFAPSNPYRGFGYALDASGNEMAISGVDYLDLTKTYVYVFRKDGNDIIQETYFTPAEVTPSDYFGANLVLSIDNDFIAATCKLNDETATDAGAVYLYRKVNGNWSFFQKITAFDGVSNGYFGNSVKIVGNQLFITASTWTGAPSANNGAVYIYNFNGTNWVYSQKLTVSSSNSLGSTIKVDNNKLVVSGNNLYTFDYDGTNWNPSSTLTPPGSYKDFNLDNNQLFILNSGTGNNQSLDIYDNVSGNWNLSTTLTSLNAVDKFGTSFIVKDNIMFISLNFHALLYTDKTPTAEYQKINGTWSFQQYHYSEGPINEDDFFGYKMAITDDFVLLTAPIERLTPPTKGRAYTINVSALGVNSNNFEEISIYPNPTTGNIQLNNMSEDVLLLDVFQIDGKLIKSIQSNFDTVSLNGLQNGVYLLKFTMNNGTTVTKKVVKL